MAQNRLPDTNTALFALGDDMSDALGAHEAEIGIKQNTQAVFDPDLQAAKDADAAFPLAQGNEGKALSARNVANSNAKGFLFLAKRQLTDDFGTAPSDDWKAVGFAPGTTQVPTDIPGRVKILDGIAAYLKANPGKEIAAKNYTQANAQALSAALTAARSALNQAVGDRSKSKSTRDTAVQTLRDRMSGLKTELGQLLDADSDEWYYFGLVPPAGAQTPAIPDSVNGHQVSATAALFAWAHAPRADHYRPFKQVIGVDASPVALPLTSELDVLLENLPAKATVKFYVTSQNAAGESVASEVVTVVLT